MSYQNPNGIDFNWNTSRMMEEYNNTEAIVSVIADFKRGLERYRTVKVWLILTLYSLVWVTAITGNILVILVILFSKRMRKLPSNYFLVNMAVTDLMVALVCIPVAMTRNAYHSWLLGEVMCRFTPYVQGVAVASGVFTITALCVDRFLAIQYPMMMRRISQAKCTRASITFVWLAAFLLMIPIGLVKQVETIPVPIADENLTLRYCKEEWSSIRVRKTYATLLVVLIYIIPGCIMCVLYFIMGRKLWKSDSELTGGVDAHSRSASFRILERRRVARLSVIVAAVFAFCWLPYYVFSTILDFKGSSVIPMDVLYYALLLGHSNCALNPLLYAFMGKAFRRNIINLLTCKEFHMEYQVSTRTSIVRGRGERSIRSS